MEIVNSPDYHKLVLKLDPEMSFTPDMLEVNKMIDYFKYQSNVEDKVSYIEKHMVTYEIMKNTHFFIEFKNLELIGLYNNQIDREYFILVKRDGSVHFIGDSIINWTNDENLYFEKEDIFEFQTACFDRYNIPTITWVDKTIKIGKTINTDEFDNDLNYQSYLKSDMLYDTYEYLRTNAILGVNVKKLRMRIRGISENHGIVAFYVKEDFKLDQCILDNRFFTSLDNVKGFVDLDILYIYHASGFVEITYYKSSKPSIFNLVGFFSNFKARLKLYSFSFMIFRFMIKMYTMIFFIDLKDDIRRFK